MSLGWMPFTSMSLRRWKVHSCCDVRATLTFSTVDFVWSRSNLLYISKVLRENVAQNATQIAGENTTQNAAQNAGENATKSAGDKWCWRWKCWRKCTENVTQNADKKWRLICRPKCRRKCHCKCHTKCWQKMPSKMLPKMPSKMPLKMPLTVIMILLAFAALGGMTQWNSTLYKCKKLFEYHHLLLLIDIWWSNFLYKFKCCSFFQHQC